MAELNQKNEHTPPLIGKMGRYTAFIKPPHITARPTASPKPKNVVDLEAQASPAVATPPQTLIGSFLGSISNAIAKIQHVHSRVDEYLADWFGLNQSKYQWEMNEYLEMKNMETEQGKPKETLGKGQEMQQIGEHVMKVYFLTLLLELIVVLKYFSTCTNTVLVRYFGSD